MAISDMVMVLKHGPMAAGMKGNGITTRRKAVGNSGTRMVMFTWVIGWMTELMVRVYTCMLMARDMKASSSWTAMKVRALKLGLTASATRVSIWLGASMVEGLLHMPMAHAT